MYTGILKFRIAYMDYRAPRFLPGVVIRVPTGIMPPAEMQGIY
jgi:hypothetical protein